MQEREDIEFEIIREQLRKASKRAREAALRRGVQVHPRIAEMKACRARGLSMREYRVLRALSDTEAQQPWMLDTGTGLPEDRLGAVCARLGRMGLADRVGRRVPATWKRSAEGARLLGVVPHGNSERT